MSDRAQIAASICEVARRAYQRRLQTGTGGNLSARLSAGQRILIKGSGASFATCTPDDLVEVDLTSGQPLNGTPSSELHSHLEIYRARSDVGAIFHCHAPWTIACAETEEAIPPIARHAADKMGLVPVLRTGPAPTPEAVAASIRRLLADHPNLKAFVEAQHGIFSFGATIELAAYGADLVEETAQISFLAKLWKALVRA